jgi:hypothetical protein
MSDRLGSGGNAWQTRGTTIGTADGLHEVAVRIAPPERPADRTGNKRVRARPEESNCVPVSAPRAGSPAYSNGWNSQSKFTNAFISNSSTF